MHHKIIHAVIEIYSRHEINARRKSAETVTVYRMGYHCASVGAAHNR
jgi:hypothetical protein